MKQGTFLANFAGGWRDDKYWCAFRYRNSTTFCFKTRSRQAQGSESETTSFTGFTKTRSAKRSEISLIDLTCVYVSDLLLCSLAGLLSPGYYAETVFSGNPKVKKVFFGAILYPKPETFRLSRACLGNETFAKTGSGQT